jgi:hypothetical protein
VDALRTLHRLGASLDSCTLDGASPAFIAAQDGKVEALRGIIHIHTKKTIKIKKKKRITHIKKKMKK